MYNFKEEIQNFKPIDLMSLKQKLGQIPEDMQSAIEMYNKAIEDVEGHNEDMAIIALKKAVAIYPAFYEAMNLMGVCYEILEDAENARKMFNKVIQMDDSSIKAAEYLDKLDGRDDSKAKTYRNNKNRSERPQIVSWIGNGLSPEKAAPYYLKYILGFAAGLIVMAVLWLASPANKPLFKFEQKIDGSEQLNGLITENETLNQRLTEAMTGLATAEQTQTGLRDEMDQYKEWSKTLRGLEALAAEGKYRDVIVEVGKLDGLSIPTDIQNEITALNDSCKPKAISQIYDSAKKIYDGNSKNKSKDVYKQAATEFSLAISIMEQVQEKPDNMLQIYYFGGKAIALSEYPSKDEANTEAIRCLNSIIALDSSSQYAYYAQFRLDEINSGRPVKP